MIKEYILIKNYYGLRKGTKIAYVGETLKGQCVFSHKNWISGRLKNLNTSKPIYEGYKGGGYRLADKNIFNYLKLNDGEWE